MERYLPPNLIEIIKFMGYYLAIGLPIVYFGGKYLYKIRNQDEAKANKISFVLITAPLLAPMLIGIFLGLFYGIIYLLSNIMPEPSYVENIPFLIIGALISIYLGIWTYIAIFKSYFNRAKKI